jgi:hypothetical protein
MSLTFWWWTTDGKIVDGPDEMRKAVREEIKYGSDWIKVRIKGACVCVHARTHARAHARTHAHALTG